MCKVANAKEHTLSDYSPMTCPEGKSIQTESKVLLAWGWGGTGSHCRWLWGIVLEWEKCSKTGLWWWLNNSANSLKYYWAGHFNRVFMGWNYTSTNFSRKGKTAMWQRSKSNGHIIIWSYLSDISIKDKPIGKNKFAVAWAGGRRHKGISQGGGNGPKLDDEMAGSKLLKVTECSSDWNSWH